VFSLSNKLRPFLPFAGFFAIALLMWLPFGFKANGGLIEEWAGIGAQVGSEPPFFITPDMEFGWWASRPLTFLAQSVGYALDPSSFAVLNLFGLLIVFGWGAGAFLALRRLLGGYDLLAFMVAALFMVYPADISLFTFRDVHNRMMIALYFLALYCLLAYWDDRRLWALIGMWLFLLIALLHYDSIYLLVAVTPLALLWRARGFTRRVFGVSLLWYVPPILSAFYVLMIGAVYGAQTYQFNVGRLGIDPLGALARLPRDYVRAFLNGWVETAASLTTHGSEFLPYVLVGSGIVLSIGLVLARRDQGRFKIVTALMLIVSGMLVIASIVLIYRLSPASQTEMRRVFYLPGFGAALVIGVVGYILLARRSALRYAYVLVMTLLFGAAMVNALRQHAYFADLGLQQQRLLGQMLALAPRLTEDTRIVVIDETGLMSDEYFFQTSSRFEDAIQFAYHDPSLRATLCHAPLLTSLELSRVPFDAPHQAACEFGDDALVLRYPVQTRLTSLDRLVVFRYTYEDELALVTDLSAYTGTDSPTRYQPQTRIASDANPLSEGLFSCVPITTCTDSPVDTLPVSPFRFEFDTQVMGGGWRSLDHWNNWTTAWMVAPDTTLWARIDDQSDQQVRFHVAGVVNQDAVEALRLTVNDTPVSLAITLHPEGGWLYEGILPAAALAPELDKLQFSLPQLYIAAGTQLQFGAALNWLEVAPLATTPNAE